MAIAATTVIISGTTPQLLVPASPVPGINRSAFLLPSGTVPIYIGGASFVGSQGFPVAPSAPFIVETKRQQDVYGAAAVANASQAVLVLEDLR